MNISFTEKQEKFIKSMVESGNFQNASEFVRAALRFYQEARENKIEALRTEIEKGLNSPASKRNVRDIIKDVTGEIV